MIKQKYNALSHREQTILKVAIPLTFLLISWLLVIKPMIDNKQKITKNILKHQQQLNWMQQNSHLVANNSTNQRIVTGSTPANKSQLRQVMGQLIKAQKISIERIQNINQRDINYQLDNNNFNSVLQLVKACEERGIEIIQVQIIKSKQLGKVNTRLTVATRES